MIDEKELRKNIEKNLGMAKSMYEKTNSKGFPPAFIIDVTRNGKRGEVVAIMGDNGIVDNRFDVSFDLGVRYGIELFLKKIDSINAVFMIFESWFNTAPKGNGAKEKMIQPSKDPNKKEGIVSAGLTKEGVSAIEMYELKKTFDIQSGKIKVEFKPAFEDDKKKDDKIEAESPLLKRFWEGVDFMTEFSSKVPPDMTHLFQRMSVDKMFDIFKNHIESIRNKK